LFTHPAYHDQVEALVMSWDTRKLSQAALETLAVIAYYQPVSREGVRAVRGVNSDGVISSLVDKGLVRELGRERGRAGAVLYGTTQVFLERFGLASIKDLPPLEDFAPDEEARQFIRDRLSGHSMQSTIEEAEEDLTEAEELSMSDEAAERLAEETGAELDGVALAEHLAVEEGDIQGALDALLEVAMDQATDAEAEDGE
jgi:segregation and condensation protein B